MITDKATVAEHAAHPPVRPRWREDWQRALLGKVGASTWRQRLTSPFSILAVAVLLIVALAGYGIGAAVAGGDGSTSPSGAPGTSMGNGTSAAPINVPNATQRYGNQLAQYRTEADGAKQFTFTARQVMWEPVKGQRVLAWTLDGTVPGPMIRITAGDHVRITIINQLPEATAIHWHGLQVPTDVDGVPPLGMKPIAKGQRYTYDFTIRDEDAGTHWYHSHYDDQTQVGGGLYGAFIVAPRPGTAQARAAISADVEYTEFVGMLNGYYIINGKSFPDTQPLRVKQGQNVRMRLIGADVDMIHPMHLHGQTFTIVAEDGHALPQPIQKDTVQLAPGETYDLTFNAWASPGSVYPFHCHILSHLSNPGQSQGEMGGLIALVRYDK
ncbi:MAG: multicopper oxidase domain-containing protein [Ktedonobacterales bacterium]|nr:multicopper oxidase domain-containing protein [Ktedonobacterales bacterium]